MSSLAKPASVFAALSLVLAACHPAEKDPRVGPPLVRVASAAVASMTKRSFSGVVSPRVQSDLGFRVSGKVTERLVDAGQEVRRGDVLMRIDRTDLGLAMTAREGQLAAAKAQLLQTAADEKRLRGLVAAGAISASAYDQAKAAADASAAQWAAATAQWNVARNEAGYTTLLADADGTVMETLAEPGQVIAAGQPVVRLAHAGPREATVSLPENFRPAIGSRAQAAIYGDDAKEGGAVLRQLSDTADVVTRTFDARYVLEGPASRAPYGATVTLRIDAGTAPTMEVPLSAIYDAGKGPGVWVVGAGNAPSIAWRSVKVRRLGAETAVIDGGLASGERFVSLGTHMLHAGQQVRVAAASGGDTHVGAEDGSTR